MRMTVLERLYSVKVKVQCEAPTTYADIATEIVRQFVPPVARGWRRVAIKDIEQETVWKEVPGDWQLDGDIISLTVVDQRVVGAV